MTHPEIARARAEQAALVALLKSGHPDREGIILAISDWFWEELLIERELGVSVGGASGQQGRV